MARRPLRPEEQRLWALVTRTVRRAAHVPPVADPAPPAEAATAAPPVSLARRARPLATADALAALAAAGVGREGRHRPRHAPPDPGPAPIEPNRKRRIVRAREPIGARLDLHGHDQDQARAALHGFIARARADGLRAVLVITGKGRAGGLGVLRARVPEWLAEAPSRAAVAGVSQAEPRHGGEGALYVALKRSG